MNKQGDSGDFVMFFSFIFLLVFVAGAVAAGVGLFYGDEYDSRMSEAQAISWRVSKCLLDNSEDFELILEGENIYQTCRIKKDLFAANLGLRICVDSLDCYTELNPEFQTQSNFEQCILNSGNNDLFGKCSSTDLFIAGQNITVIGFSNNKKEIIIG